ncbi:MAG: ABC transporter substrate-binding protein [Alphaproteobacteria bacterium]
MAVTRRKVLKGGTALAGGMAGILATGRAPAFAQGTTVHWIRWNDFVPASDQLLRKDLIPEAEKALGIKINFETVNGNDLQPRITSAIQSGAGPDVFMLFNNHPQIYSESLVDMSDVTDAVAKAQGGYYDLAKANSADGGKWISAPWAVVGALIVYRKSWFEEIGYSSFPDTWEKYRDAAKKLKAKGRPNRSDARPYLRRQPDLHLPVHVVVGRHRDREGRQDGRHQQERSDRLGQVHDRVLEGRP